MDYAESVRRLSNDAPLQNWRRLPFLLTVGPGCVERLLVRAKGLRA
jgi:hypothetical protein